MATGRTHSPPRNRLLTPSKAGDENMFPLTAAIEKACSINKALPNTLAENINPPFDVARRLFFNNEYEDGQSHLDDGRLMHSAGQGNPKNAPRSFITEEPWKIPTWYDMNFVFGTNEIVPHGFEQRHPNPINIFDETNDDGIDFDDEYVSIPNHPALEETLFDKQPERIEHDDTLRTEARRFLESTQQTFVRMGGCTEKQILREARGRYCCYGSSLVRSTWQYDPEELAKRLFFKLHQRPWCVKNKPCHFLLHSLDVSAPTKDNKQLAHVFSIRFTHDSSLRDQVFNVLKEAKAENILNYDSTEQRLNPVSEFDLGFMQVNRNKKN